MYLYFYGVIDALAIHMLSCICEEFCFAAGMISLTRCY